MKKTYGTGFTLIEMLIYISLASLVLLAISSFFQISLSSRVKSKTIAEVEQQGIQILNLINQYAINATAINSPSVGSSGTSLSLQMPSASSNPTIFSFNSGDLLITEGVASPVILNSSNVEVTSVNFRNLSQANTPGLIRAEISLSHINNSNQPEFYWDKTFYTSISLRKF